MMNEIWEMRIYDWKHITWSDVDNPDPRLRGLEVEFDYIGEGWSGDYDPEDPNDVPLLRFTVLLDGEPVDDGSYCTQMPIDTDEEILLKALKHLYQEASDTLFNGQFKKTMEWCSWMRPIEFVLGGK